MTHVLMATPLGFGGKGGIDRVVDELRTEARAQPGAVRLRVLTTRGQGHIALAPFHLLAATAELLARRAAGRADVLHVHLSSDGSTWRKIVLCEAARRAGVPYVVHLHGSRYREFLDGAGPRTHALVRRMFAGAAIVLVLGEAWRALLLRHMPELAGRIRILPNASRPSEALGFPRAGRVPHILFLGKVGARKGVPVLLEALSRLPPGRWRATVAGDGDVEEARLAVHRLGLNGRVALPGWVGPDAVAALLREAEILALPSFNENLPMSVIEAMAHGLAVVATPVGAVAEIVRDGETGLLVQPGDAAGLAAALGRLLAAPDERARLGAAAASFHARHLHISPYFAQLAALWHEVAGAGASVLPLPSPIR